MQRPHIGNDIAPRRDFNLDAQAGQHTRHIGDGLLQRQIFADNIGAGVGRRIQRQQGLRVGIQVLDFFNHELRPGLHHFFHGAAVNGTQNTLAVLVGDIGWQFDLDLENLLITVFRIDNIVLREADIFGRNIASCAIQLHKISRA